MIRDDPFAQKFENQNAASHQTIKRLKETVQLLDGT